jgi:serine/threonine protein kinase
MRSQSSDQREIALPAGRVLQRGRYRLLEPQGQQRWSESVYEVWWLVQDMEAAGTWHKTICEVVLPESGLPLPKILQPAMRSMLSAGIHPSIARLLDVFQEEGHGFFVFERPAGGSLQGHMQRTRSILAEQEVITCCLHITEALLHLSQQNPPIVHGLISPDRIVAVPVKSESANVRWTLTNFSLALACGATPYLTNRESIPLSPFSPPECARGTFTTQTDLYTLLAVAYYAVTGSVPEHRGSMVPARQINHAVSERFSALLAKGLAPVAQARFQQPSELYQALGGNPAPDAAVSSRRAAQDGAAQSMPGSVQSPSPSEQHLSPSVVPSQPRLKAQALTDERSILFPDPAKLPPLLGSNDALVAAGWIAGTLLCEAILLIAAK